MARKTSLRDFQEYLATRLSQAAKGKGAASWLGVEAGGEHGWSICRMVGRSFRRRK
jgi:hypothetical protein